MTSTQILSLVALFEHVLNSTQALDTTVTLMLATGPNDTYSLILRSTVPLPASAVERLCYAAGLGSISAAAVLDENSNPCIRFGAFPSLSS